MTPRDQRVMLLGAVALLLSAGLGAAFSTGPRQPPDGGVPDMVADWSSTFSNTMSEYGQDSQIVSFDIVERNLTRLTVRLMWTDDEIVGPLGRRDDLLTLRVDGPSTLDVTPSQQTSGTGGDLVLEWDLADLPTDPDPDNFDDHAYDNATGTWEVRVSVEPRGLRDTGNDWTVSVSYTYYVGRLLEVPGES